MKWIRNRCRCRADVSLLASGALREDEKSEVERHLAACHECRVYHGEIRKMTATLANWENNLTAIEATPATQTRWARVVQQADLPSSHRQPLLKNLWRIVWGELIWPCRHVWTGMAALWVVMLAVNGLISDLRAFEPNIRVASTPDIMAAWQEQNRVLAELTQPSFTVPAAPVVSPRPRSALERSWQII
jgi:anti-sigma factor RsiW